MLSAGQRFLLRDQSRQRGCGSCSSQHESRQELHGGDKAAANLMREQSDRDNNNINKYRLKRLSDSGCYG